MALADIETEFTQGVPWRTCAVCHYLSERPTEWGDALRRLLANRSVQFSELAKALADDPDEPNLDRQALSRHARGECAAKERLR